MPTQDDNIYEIVNWDAYFENAQSRKYNKLRWVPVPNKHDGLTYKLLMDSPKGPEIFAAWILIIEVASKCTPRGILIKSDGQPHNPKSLNIITSAPEKLFEEAFAYLRKCGWIQQLQDRSQCTTSTLPPCSHRAPTVLLQEGKKEGKKERKKEKKHTVIKSKDNDDQIFADEFNKTIWKIYPKRNPHPEGKNDGLLKYIARRKSGMPFADAEKACKSYAFYLKKENTLPRFIMQCGKFFGEKLHYAEFINKPVDSEGEYNDRF